MKMVKTGILLALIGVLTASSLGFAATKKNSTTRKRGNLLREFMCSNHQNLTVENISKNTIKFADGYGGIYYLDKAVAASGEKYENDDMSIHMKGKDAIFTQDGKDLSCSLTKTSYGSIKEY